MGQNLTESPDGSILKTPTGVIPDPFWCYHIVPEQIVELYKNDSDHPNYYKCNICGSEFPVIGDTDKWEPVMVDYDKPS